MGRHRKATPSRTRYRITGLSALVTTFATSPLALAATPENAITQDIMSAPADNVWDRLAECESSGDWDIDTGNGYEGGLQFSPSTWRGFGGLAFAPSAADATREQQIAVATRVQKAQGWNAWPTCTKRLGISGDPGTSVEPAVPTNGNDRPSSSSARTSGTVPSATATGGSATKSSSATTNPKCIELKAAGTQLNELDALSSRNPGWGLDGDGDGVPCEVTFPRTAPTQDPTPSKGTPVSSSVLGTSIVSSARDWVGTPYKWGGTSSSGVDCSGLVLNVLRDLGINPPRTSTAQSQWVTKVSRSEARPGDLVFNAGRVHHVGIYLGDGMMIDAPKPGTKVGVHKLYKDMTVFGRVPS